MLQRRLEVSWNRRKTPTCPTVCNNLAQKKCLNQCFLARSDVRVNGNAVNSSVLLIVNFSGRSCQVFFFFAGGKKSMLNAGV